MTDRLVTAALACAALCTAPIVASAHAFLKTAEPAVGGTMKVAPTTVRIDFTEGVEPQFSTIEVTDDRGRRVDDGDVHLQGGDDHLAVGLKPLVPGRYTVGWKAVAVDTHRTEGNFHFTVAP